MKKVLLILVLFISFSFADNLKQFTLACNSYEDIINIKDRADSLRDGAIPENCLLLTTNANISVVDDRLEDSRIVKILIIDLGTHMYSLKEDIIITNENKI